MATMNINMVHMTLAAKCIRTLTLPSTAAAVPVWMAEAAGAVSDGEGVLLVQSLAASLLLLRLMEELREPHSGRQLRR
jgi:hypothetical protein